VCCRRVATDKRSHAWIRKTNHTHAGRGRNWGNAQKRWQQCGCNGDVADSAQVWKPTVRKGV